MFVSQARALRHPHLRMTICMCDVPPSSIIVERLAIVVVVLSAFQGQVFLHEGSHKVRSYTITFKPIRRNPFVIKQHSWQVLEFRNCIYTCGCEVLLTPPPWVHSLLPSTCLTLPYTCLTRFFFIVKLLNPMFGHHYLVKLTNLHHGSHLSCGAAHNTGLWVGPHESGILK